MKVGPVVEVRSVAVKKTPPTVDPVLTEVVRHGLNATAEQMKVTLCRTAFSPVIYEMIDFAAGIYDTEYRMLAQARALPQFLGTLSFCLEAAVGRLGGLDRIHPGDVIWSTDGYDNGSHPQDAVVIVPAFDGERLVAFAVTKAHHLDIAAKDPYCTDTTDNFQEGVIFPAVKVYAGGELQRDMYRTILANSRAPKALEGDLNAQISAGAAGVAGLLRMMERHGSDPFWNAVEAMFNHGEAATRRFLESIPDGRYSADCQMDNNGITNDLVKFSVTIEVSGSEAVVDFSDCPPQQEGPINCPWRLPWPPRGLASWGYSAVLISRMKGTFARSLCGSRSDRCFAQSRRLPFSVRMGPRSGDRGDASSHVSGAALDRPGWQRRRPVRVHSVGHRPGREVLDHGYGSPGWSWRK